MKKLVVFASTVIVLTFANADTIFAKGYFLKDQQNNSYYFEDKDLFYIIDDMYLFRVFLFTGSKFLQDGILVYNSENGRVSMKLFENERFYGFSVELRHVDWKNTKTKISGLCLYNNIPNEQFTVEEWFSVGNY